MRLYSVLLFLLFFSSAHAQKIHFTDSTNVWNELQIGMALPWTTYTYSTFTFLSDATIHGSKYRWFNFDDGYCGSCGSYIREDTLLHKVFILANYLDTTFDTDVVLMDYNLNLGDTFLIKYNLPHVFLYVVTAKDSTLINSVWHKTWKFEGFVDGTSLGVMGHCQVIEGIGCIEHPTFMLGGIYDGEVGYLMYCFSNRGITPPLSPPVSFLNNTTSCSYYPAILNAKTTERKDGISIFPNPANNELTIKFSIAQPYTATLTNMMGQTVKILTGNSKEENIDISDLPAGVYSLCTNSGQINHKVVIVH